MANVFVDRAFGDIVVYWPPIKKCNDVFARKNIIMIIITYMFIRGNYLISTRKYCYQQGPC